MFQPSGPDHMLNKTEWFLNCFRPLPSPESESQFKTKDTRIYNLKGPRDDQSPPQYLEKIGELFCDSLSQRCEILTFQEGLLSHGERT